MGFIVKILAFSGAIAAGIVGLGAALPSLEPNPAAAAAAVTLPVAAMAALLARRQRPFP